MDLDSQGIRRFLIGFMSLTLLSGITIGMNKVMGTLLGLHLGLSNLELGFLSSTETAAVALGTLPAGYLLTHSSPRTLYVMVCLVLAALYLFLPHLPHWHFLIIAMFIVGLCISLRIVSMNTLFLTRLPELGHARAGWYRGTLTFGIQFSGPVCGNYLVANLGIVEAFLMSSVLFVSLALLGWKVLPPQLTHQVLVQRPQTSSRLDEMRYLLSFREVRTSYVFECAASMTMASVSVFSIVIAVQSLGWSKAHAVWLLAIQGMCYMVTVIFFGKHVLKDRLRNRVYTAGHALIVTALVLMACSPHDIRFILASACMGIGLGINYLINTNRISGLPVNKAQLSANLTLLTMTGSGLGALMTGFFSDWFGFQGAFLVLFLIWLVLLFAWRQDRS